MIGREVLTDEGELFEKGKSYRPCQQSHNVSRIKLLRREEV